MRATAVIWAIIYCVALLVLWGPLVDCMLVGDDNNLVYNARIRQPAVLADLKPLGNGYWRPLPLMISRILHASFGTQPEPYHAAMLLLHFVNAGLCALLCLRLGAWPMLAGMCGLLFLLHPGGYMAVAQFKNVGDMTMTAFGLVTLLLLLPRIHVLSAWPWIRLAGLGTFIMASKETGFGFVLPCALVFLFFARNDRGRDSWRTISFILSVFPFVLLFLLSSLRLYAVQSNSRIKMMDFSANCVVQFLDYPLSFVLPNLFMGPNPITGMRLPSGALWAVRAMIAALVLFGLVFTWRRRQREALVLLVGGFSMIVLPSLTLAGPDPRYFYSAGAMWSVLTVTTLVRSEWSRRWCAAVLSAFMVWLLPATLLSYPREVYVRHAHEMERITKALRHRAAGIPPNCTVAIGGHPYNTAMTYPFGHFWIANEFPDKHWGFSAYPDPTGRKENQVALRWNGKTLAEAPRSGTGGQ